MLLFLIPASLVLADGLGDGSDGSPNISGIVNTYTAVTAIVPTTCTSSISVISSAGFTAGDLVLVIQMENALINTTNTPSYGTILNYNNSGNFEYAKIFSVTGTIIQTVAPLVNNYDVLGVVQLVRVPQYVSPVITGAITCLPWNGLIGGIVALDATGTITMNADIDAGGKGFKGGFYQAGMDIYIHYANYVTLNHPDTFSLKGEGIASYNIAPFISGRGAAANGGGGGNCHNGGGGGGSNAGCGGNGGYGYTDPGYGLNYTDAQGIGGYALSNAGSSFKIFMGGGAGAGHSDNLSNSSGGYGGGLILITATNLTGNSYYIKSSGSSALATIKDGAGGGGAGGTIVVDCSNINSTVKIEAQGGDGGSIDASGNPNPHGPGGGGGGGLAVFTSASLPANVIVSSLTGGAAGLCDIVTTNGALSGCAGATKFNITIVKQFTNPTFTSVKDTAFCDNGSLTLTATTGNAYLWSPAAGLSCTNCQAPTATINAATIYVATVNSSSCIYIDSFKVDINPLPNVTLSNYNSICVDASALALSGGSPAGGTYIGTGVSANNFDPAVAGVGTHAITYSYTDANGCTNSATKNILVNALPIVTLSAINPVCIASSAFALATGTPAGGTYSGTGVSAGNFTPSTAGVGTHKIFYSYTDVNGCSNIDSTTITVYNIPQVTFTPVNPVCDGTSAFALTGGSPAGGTYSGVGVTGTNFDPAIAGIGTQTITYTFTDVQGCSNSTTTNITVNALPNVTLLNFNSVCVDASSFSLSGGNPGGGTYTGTGVSTNNFDPSIAGVGTYAITYTYIDANGCSNSKTKNIIVNALPEVTLSAINPVCIASSAFALSGGSPAGGTYFGTGVTTGTFTPSTAGIGTHTIYYSYTDANGCSNIDSATITVYNLPQVTFTPVNPVCDGTPAFALTGGSPAGGTYSGVGVTGIDFDPAMAGIGTQTITYTYTDAQGCSNSTTTNFTVNALPNVTLSNFNSVCIDASTFALSGGSPTGGIYTGTGVTANNFDPATVSVGSYPITYTYTDANGCSNTKTKNITVDSLPTVTLSAINPVCIASSAFALTTGTPSGGTYSGTGVSAGNFTPSTAGIGTHTIYYSYSDVNGCSNADSTTITVYNIPQVTFTPVNPVCDGTPAFALTGGSPAGGTYSGVGVTGTDFDPAIAGIGTQIITYTYTDAQGCSNSTTTNITVNALPNVTLVNFSSVCIDAATFALSGGSPTGGIYTGTGVTANNFDPATVSVGSYPITYTYTDANGCSNTKTKNITVDSLPIVTLSAINPVCIASAAFALTTGTPSGGTYSGTGVSGGDFTPSTAGIGTHTIYYSYSDVNGCSNIDSTTIIVYNIPQVTFTPVNPVCDGTPAFALTGGSPAGGAYSGVGVAGTDFDPAIAGIGTQTITYTYTDAQGCSNSTSTDITVNVLPNVTLSNYSPVCIDESSFAITGGNPSGGTYTGTGVVANNFDPAIAGAGTHAITYFFTDANGCSNSAVKNIIVNPLPTVTLSAINSVCILSSTFALTTGTPSGGIYSGTGVSTGNFTPSTAGIGTHTIYYSYTDVSGCSNIDSTTITVYNIPQVTFTPVNPVCDGTLAFVLTGGSPAGGAYSGVGVTGTNFDPAIAGIGTQTITYTYSDAQGCSNSATTNITVNALPNVTLSNFSSVCKDASSFALNGGNPAGGTYSGTGVSANNFNPSTAGAGTHAILYSYTDANGCSNSATKNIIVNALPTVALSPTNSVCILSPAFALTTGTPSGGMYSGTGVNAGNFTPATAGIGTHTVYYSYSDVNGCSGIDSTTITVYNIPQVTFTPVNPVCDGTPAFALTGGSPAGGAYSGVGVTGTNFDPAIAGIGTQAITYTYMDAQGCSNSATTNIAVNALPNVTLSNFNSVCIDASTFALSGGNPSGGTYTGMGVTVNNFAPAAAGTGTYPITYSYTDANGCSNTKTKNITVNSLPTVTLSAMNSVCIASTTFALTAGTPSGGTYSGTGVSAGNFTPATAGIGTHTIYYFYNDINGCSNTDSTTITVYNIPQVTFTSVNPVCDGTPAFVLTGGSPAGGSYSGVGVTGNNFDPVIAGIGTQTITYSYTDAQGCSNSTTTNITVNALPIVALSNFNAVCVNVSTFALSGGSPSGGTYTGTGVSTNNFNPIAAGVGIHAITYSFTDANGCSNSSTKNITVNALPIVTLSAINSVCIASSAFSLTTGTPSGGVYSGTGVNAGSFTPSTAGIGTHIIYYSYSDVNGCSNIDSTTITVYDIPQVTFTPVNPVCEGTTAFVLTGGIPAGGIYSGVGVTGTYFDPAIAGIGTQTITYTYTDAQGCSNAATSTMTVNALPNVTLANFSSVCENAQSFALNGGLPLGGIYSGTGVTGNNFNSIVAGVGTHAINYAFTDSNSCTNSATKNLIVNPLIFLNAGNDETICSGYNIQLNVSGATTVHWSPSTGLNCTSCVNPFANPILTSSYIVSSSLPCSTNDTVTVNVIPAVFVDAGNDTLLCFGESIKLNAVSNYSSYNWNLTNDLSCINCPDPVSSPSATAVYTVTSTNGFCAASDSILVKVIKVNVAAGNDVTIVFGESIKLNGTGANSYIWSPGLYLNDSTLQSPIASPYSTTQYIVTGNIDRCSATDTVAIEIIYIGDAIFVPNAFTPDGDGKNDLFGAVHAGKYDSFEMKIFNRWGEMLFKSDDISEYWNGISKGMKQPEGVYIYQIHLVSGKNKINKVGNVTLIR